MLKSLLTLCIWCAFACTLSCQIYTQLEMDSTKSFTEIVEEAELYFDQQGRGPHTGYKAFKRWQYWMKRCLDANGKMMTGTKNLSDVMEFQASQEQNGVFSSEDIAWEELGPFSSQNTTGWSSHLGRLTSISVDPNDQAHIIVGSPTGGVWKTLDEGQNWTPIFDKQMVTKVFSLAINPSNAQEYFVGTRGGGILRSQDGGDTWTLVVGVPKGTRIIDIKIDPADPLQIYAINEGGNIYMTKDGGDNWRSAYLSGQILYDLEFKPDETNVIYASGINTLVRSVDAGLTWQVVPGPWHQNRLFNPLMLATTPAAPNSIYVLEAQVGGFKALHLSTDGGQTWLQRSSDDNNDNNLLGYDKMFKGGQAPRDMDIVVSPDDKDEIHLGGIMSHRSLDGGKTWSQTSHWLIDNPLPFIHADVDMMHYAGNIIYFLTDGGLFLSRDRAASFEDKSTGLNIRQFYRMDVAADHTVIAGSQDNGASKYTQENGWLDITGADGMEPVIDKFNTDNIYSSIQYGNLYKTTDGGWTLSGAIAQTPGFGDWVTPFIQDPIASNTLYQGKRHLYKSTDAGWSWNPISDFVMQNPLDTLMQEVDIFSRDGNYIVCGFAEEVFKTINGGRTWQNITPDIDFTNVNYISIHPNDKNWIVLALSGTDDRVLQTTDGGVTWRSIFGNLPDVGVECVLYEGGPKNGLYVSMNPGVYYKNSDHREWQFISMGMPNVAVTELAIVDCSLYACTFGRGMWQTNLLDDSRMYADSDRDGYGDPNNVISYCLNEVGYVYNADDCNDHNPQVHLESNGTLWYIDADGDGYGDPATATESCALLPLTAYVADNTDCDDTDAAIYPGQTEVCDGVDNNCDGIAEDLETYYRDADGDGYGIETQTTEGCTPPPGYSLAAGDCDDTDAAIHPGQTEVCDGLDNNCDGLAEDLETYYRDADGDGYGIETQTAEGCTPPAGYSLVAGDCDDTDAAIHPGQTEVCDGLDNNCDGLAEDLETYYRDADGDGYGIETQTAEGCTPPAGYSLVAGDCDDTDAAIHPGQREVCDGLDNNCDGLAEDLKTYYRDADGDGYGIETQTAEGCTPPAGYSLVARDCDDTDAAIHPGQTEVCDGLDNNCDGLAEDLKTYYRDADGDGYGIETQTAEGCTPPPGYSLVAGDCDDTDAAIYPGQTEVCDGLDNNCDGLAEDLETYYRDADGDGYGIETQTVEGCTPPAGYSLVAGDCDDTDSAIHPGQTEVCDGLDNNCDGLAENLETYYRDADGDGYGIETQTAEGCTPPAGYSQVAGDCDDTDAAIHPGQTEVCDGLDNNCDGLAENLETYYRDADGDGYGIETQTAEGCTPPAGYSLVAGDCDDTDSAIHPAQTEVCDGLDNNCDGLAEDLKTYYRDADGDGYGIETQTAEGCTPPAGYSLVAGDCDDTDAAIHPGQTDICDEIDNDCDGLIDEDCDEVPPCDGVFIFVHSFTRDAFRAERRSRTDAVLKVDDDKLITAGAEIELLSGFEVPLGAQFEARIAPCLTSKSSQVSTSDLLDANLYNLFGHKSPVSVSITDDLGNVLYNKNISLENFVRKQEINILPPGIYWMRANNEKTSAISKIIVVDQD